MFHSIKHHGESIFQTLRGQSSQFILEMEKEQSLLSHRTLAILRRQEQDTKSPFFARVHFNSERESHLLKEKQLQGGNPKNQTLGLLTDLHLSHCCVHTP